MSKRITVNTCLKYCHSGLRKQIFKTCQAKSKYQRSIKNDFYKMRKEKIRWEKRILSRCGICQCKLGRWKHSKYNLLFSGTPRRFCKRGLYEIGYDTWYRDPVV